MSTVRQKALVYPQQEPSWMNAWPQKETTIRLGRLEKGERVLAQIEDHACSLATVAID